MKKREQEILRKNSFQLKSTVKVWLLVFAVCVSIFPITMSAQTEEGSEQIVFENLRKISPDGQYVTYVTARNLGMSEATIWIAKVDGSEAKALVSSGEGFWVTNPIWSPDSSQIGFIKVIKADQTDFDVVYSFEIRLIDIDGSNHRLLTDTYQLKPSLGYGGQTELTWNREGEIEFYDNTSLSLKQYGISVTTGIIRLIGEQPVYRGPIRQPSNVPLFKQCDSRWGGNRLGVGSCSHTICSAGCAMTSVAMLLKYFGANVDPGSLNSWLQNNGGYLNCLIYWGTAANYQSGVTYIGSISTTDKTRVRQELDAGYPVIVGVNNDGHYVVVTRYSGDSYYINDPGYNRTLLASYGNNISRIIIYHGSINNTLCGELSGTIGPGQYSVTCDIYVNSGQSLTIQSGTVLNGLENHSFTVNGELMWYP